MIRIERYAQIHKDEWNEFVSKSKQGTFLIDRNYMDYHSDRFSDHSLMIFRNDKLYALLPANEQDHTLYSHQGLTYGGLISNEKASASEICTVFRSINEYLRETGFKKVIYKAIPWIYHRVPAQEDLYAIIKECNARILVRNISSSINMCNQPKWNRDRHYGANKAQTDGITVTESNDLASFWQILNDNLSRTYNASPVHSLQEMDLLKKTFPSNIKLYVAQKDDKMLGGTVIYITPQVVHTQYISATEEGKHAHAIDAIFRKLLSDVYKTSKYFDFGTSNEDGGRILNESLIYQKEGFGGRGVVYDTYVWDL